MSTGRKVRRLKSGARRSAISIGRRSFLPKRPAAEIAYDQYVDLLIRAVANTIYEDPGDGSAAFSAEQRAVGLDRPSLAHTMVGEARLRNLADLTTRVLKERVPGDLIETGVWRGGSCILMKGLLSAFGDQQRRVFVADSFAGLPKPDEARYPVDKGDMLWSVPELAIPLERVQDNFRKYDLLDERVVFVKGFFKDTLPTLRGETFALIRLDGDMFESTMDALVNLYDRLSPGGFVIVDDYGLPSCAGAVETFRGAQRITAPMHAIDWTGRWWQKSY